MRCTCGATNVLDRADQRSFGACKCAHRCISGYVSDDLSSSQHLVLMAPLSAHSLVPHRRVSRWFDRMEKKPSVERRCESIEAMLDRAEKVDAHIPSLVSRVSYRHQERSPIKKAPKKPGNL